MTESSGALASNWDICIDKLYPTIKDNPLPQETDMNVHDPRSLKTRQQVAMEKMLQRGPLPPVTQLHERRFDDEISFAEFCASHEFITNIISYGSGTYVVEWLE